MLMARTTLKSLIPLLVGMHSQLINVGRSSDIACLDTRAKVSLRKKSPLSKVIDIERDKKLPPFDPCKKATAGPMKATSILKLLHAEIFWLAKHPLLSAAQYAINLYDEHGGMSLVRFLEAKKEANRSLKGMIP